MYATDDTVAISVQCPACFETDGAYPDMLYSVVKFIQR